MESSRTSNGGRHKVLWWLGGLLLLVLVGLYAVGWYLTNSRVAAGTTVDRVEIGGMTPEEARDEIASAHLTDDFGDIRLIYGRKSFTVSSAGIGLAVDPQETVAAAQVAGTSWSPLAMAESLAGRHGSDVAPVLTLDRQSLRSAIADISARLEMEAVEPGVTFSTAGTPRVTEPRPGLTVDERATTRAVLDALPPVRPVRIVATETQPAVTSAEVDAALGDLGAAPLLPLPLQLDRQTKTLPVSDFARALTLEVQDGELVPLVDSNKLSKGVAKLAEQVDVAPVNARVKLRGGRPAVIPAVPGVRLDEQELARSIASALTESGGERFVKVASRIARPAFTTRDARDLGTKEVVSDFVTYFPYAEYRNVNQGRAAELISGTVLKPEELFSFNDTVGERTRANGFVKGFIISNGVFAEDLGGGVSQVVTTTYNAAFFAGLEDVEHTPHSFYIDRYPEGREATVAWPTVDLKFRNNTPYGVLIEAWVVPSTPQSQGEMHVRMWSTKYWDIEAGVSERRKFTRPEVRYDPSDACVATTGYGGFTVDVYRYFREPGSKKVVNTETDRVAYTPADTVICSEPPKPKKPPPPPKKPDSRPR